MVEPDTEVSVSVITLVHTHIWLVVLLGFSVVESERPVRGPHSSASTIENPNKANSDMSMCTSFITLTLTSMSGSTISQQQYVCVHKRYHTNTISQDTIIVKKGKGSKKRSNDDEGVETSKRRKT